MALENARQFESEGLYYDALRELAEMPTGAFVDPEPWVIKARCESSLGRYSEAVNSLLEALRLEPGNVEARWALADTHLSRGNTEAALGVYEALIPDLPLEGDEEALALADMALVTIVEILEETVSREAARERASIFRERMGTSRFPSFNAAWERLGGR